MKAIKFIIKKALFLMGILLASPMILFTRLEEIITKKRAGVIFGWSREIISLIPTILGEFVRLGYYWGVCSKVSRDASFQFGSMLARQDTIIGAGTVIGAYSIIGYADIGEKVLIGPRVSIISGKYLHGRPAERAEGKSMLREREIISVGNNSWIGQDAILMASVGENCTVGAGSVVYKTVPDNTTVLGNPARKVNVEMPKKSEPPLDKD